MAQQRQTYGKLVRDRIPEIIEAAGATASYHRLDNDEYFDALTRKICEEAEELRVADHDARLGELADVWEVLASLVSVLGLSEEQVRGAASRKRAERGGFDQRPQVRWWHQQLGPRRRPGARPST